MTHLLLFFPLFFFLLNDHFKAVRWFSFAIMQTFSFFFCIWQFYLFSRYSALNSHVNNGTNNNPFGHCNGCTTTGCSQRYYLFSVTLLFFFSVPLSTRCPVIRTLLPQNRRKFVYLSLCSVKCSRGLLSIRKDTTAGQPNDNVYISTWFWRTSTCIEMVAWVNLLDWGIVNRVYYSTIYCTTLNTLLFKFMIEGWDDERSASGTKKKEKI